MGWRMERATLGDRDAMAAVLEACGLSSVGILAPQVRRYEEIGWYPDERAFVRSAAA